MFQQTLKLVKASDVPVSPNATTDTGSLRFEQRRHTRHAVTLRATAVIRPADPDASLNKIRSLALMNMSDGGLGATCQDAIEPGSQITVFIPPHGPERGHDVFGRVIRCDRRDYGFEIGVTFDRQLAAA